MGELVGKASGRTFSARSTYIPAPCWSSLSVASSDSDKMSTRPPSEALKSGLPMPVFATTGLLGLAARGVHRFGRLGTGLGAGLRAGTLPDGEEVYIEDEHAVGRDVTCALLSIT
jgi:hypothetical protein